MPCWDDFVPGLIEQFKAQIEESIRKETVEELVVEALRQRPRERTYYGWFCSEHPQALIELRSGDITEHVNCPRCKVDDRKDQPMILVKLVDNITSLSAVIKTDEQQDWWSIDNNGRINLE